MQSKQRAPYESRPWYLTVVAILLVIWGLSMTLVFLPGTLSAIASARGPWFPLAFTCLMQVVWVAILASGIGLYKGAPWARPLLIAALIAMVAATAIPAFRTEDWILSKLIIYPLLVWSTFTRRASAFFASRGTVWGPIDKVEPT